MSTDGGSTWARNDNGLHVDHHIQTYSPDGNTLYIGNDGGIWKTTTPTAANTSWANLNNTLNTAMFYPGISISPNTLNTTFGGTQDNGTLKYQGNLAWNGAQVCGDGGFTAIDFTDPQVVYASCTGIYGGWVWKYNGNSWSEVISGLNTQDRSAFIPPLVMDPGNSRRLYFGTYRVYQTLDGANSWTAISPDLTSTGCNCPIFTIAVAPSDPNTIYTGSQHGVVFVTRNALSGTGATWTAHNLPTLPNQPSSQSLTQITVDPQNPLTAWAAVSDTAYGSRGHVYRTTDGGGTWSNLSAGLPNLTVDDLLLDPDIANTIYAATDVGVYRSVDGGQSWLPLGSGMPNVIVHSIRLDRPSRTLRAATYGRGMWDLSVPVPAACAYSLSVASITPAASGGSYSVTVTAPSGCAWTATSNATWLTITSGVTGSGNGTVNGSVAANTSTASRTGTLTVAGQTFTVNQAGASSSGAGQSIAVFRASGGQGIWVLDNGNNVYDAADKFRYFGLAGDQAVAGDWTGNGQTRLGVFRNGLWYLDLNNNGQWDGVAGGDGIFAFGLPGDVAVVGDWNGDGRTKLGVFRCPQSGAGACTWVLDMAGKFAYDPATAKALSYGLPGDTPVVNNWNGTSNVDQIGVYRPMANGLGLWIVDSNGSGGWDASDAMYWYGLAQDIPVVGNWNNAVRKRIGVFRNGTWILDTNGNNAYDAAGGVGSFGLPGDKPVVGNWSMQ